jgi:hypothetical protein
MRATVAARNRELPHQLRRAAFAHQWDDPQSLYVGLGDGPAVNDRVAGSWWFAALDSLYGEKAVRQWLAALVANWHVPWDATTWAHVVIVVPGLSELNLDPSPEVM